MTRAVAVAGTVLGLVLVLGGCSARKDIIKNAQRIDFLAGEIQGEMERGLEKVERGEAPRDELESSLGKAGEIRTLAKGVQIRTADVEERESEWTGLIRLGLIVACIVAVVVLVWKLGLGLVIRPFMKRLGKWISPSERRARFDAELMENPSRELVREKVAMERSIDPVYEQEFVKRYRNGKTKEQEREKS